MGGSSEAKLRLKYTTIDYMAMPVIQAIHWPTCRLTHIPLLHLRDVHLARWTCNWVVSLQTTNGRSENRISKNRAPELKKVRLGLQVTNVIP